MTDPINRHNEQAQILENFATDLITHGEKTTDNPELKEVLVNTGAYLREIAQGLDGYGSSEYYIEEKLSIIKYAVTSFCKRFQH